MSIGINSYITAYSNVLGGAYQRGNTVGTDKQYGAWYNQLYNSKRTSQAAAAFGSQFDYKAKQAELKAQWDAQKDTNTKLTALKKDSAEFLKTYTNDMTELGASANAVRGQNLSKLIGDASNGQISEENMKQTTDAVEKMVNDYNSTLTTLSENTDRGSAVAQQAGRLIQSPGSEKVMNMVGITRGENGKLSFDKEKFSSTLSNAAAADARLGSSDRLDFYKDLIGGSSGIASRVAQTSQAARNVTANSLINNDLAKMQAQQTPVDLNNIYTRAGSGSIQNMGTAGLLMNVFA